MGVSKKKIRSFLKEDEYAKALEGLILFGIHKDIDFSEFILFKYFSETEKHLRAIEEPIAKKYPEIFIKAIRTNRVFLQSDRWSFLNNLSINENFHIHQRVWRHLRKLDNELWNEILKNVEALSDQDIEAVFIELIFWLEEQRYKSDSAQNQTYLASVYNFFIELYLNKYPTNTIKMSDDFFEVFSKKYTLLLGKKLNYYNSLNKLLNVIYNWTRFKEDTLDVYCFDLQMEPKLENGIIYFNQKPENYYQWKLDGIRYQKNKTNYHLKALSIVGEEVRNGKLIIPGQREESFKLNFRLAVRQKQADLQLDDLCIENYVIDSEKVDVRKLIPPILTYATNRFFRYELTIDKYKNNTTSWAESYMGVISEIVKSQIEIYPFLLMSKKEFLDINKKVFEGFEDYIFEKIISAFSFQIDTENDFDRFNLKYDVWNTPLIEIGAVLFSPMAFFGNNDWFYAAAIAGIKNLNLEENIEERDATSEKMEKYLGSCFKKKKFKVKVITKQEATKVDGDIDVIVEDTNNTLCIQLKRTYFRLNVQNTYYELINSDYKAAQQLRDGINFLGKENNIYPLKHAPIGWIVSTSFENINSNIKGFRKINYFELLQALENPKLTTVKDVINYLEHDKHIFVFNNQDTPDLKENFNQGELESYGILLEMVGLPLEIVKPEFYLQPMFKENNFSKEYFELYRKALTHYDKNDRRTIKILKQCLLKNPNDVDVHASLGNCYANIKDSKNFKFHFEKALNLIPNEPYIQRNYAIALLQTNQCFLGLKMLLDLWNRYPYIGDIFTLIMNGFGLYKDSLSDNERKILNDLFLKP